MFTARIAVHPTTDLPGTLLQCDFAGNRFLFGRLAEGTQRALLSRGSKLSRVRQIFLTGQTSFVDQMGGLPGLVLSAADQGLPQLAIYGDKNIAWAIATLRHAVFRDTINLTVGHAAQDIVNDYMTVVPVALGDGQTTVAAPPPSDTIALNDYIAGVIGAMFPRAKPTDTTNNNNNNNSFDEIAYAAKRFPKDQLIRAPDLARTNGPPPAISYIIQPHSVRGKFNGKKADELGIPKDSTRNAIINGKPYTLANGTVITTDMLLDPDQDIKRIIYLDIPTLTHFNQAKHKNWLAHVPSPAQHKNDGMRTNVDSFEPSNAASPPSASVVIHQLGPDVHPFSPEYIEFMNQFGPECEHIIGHPDYIPDSISHPRSAQLNTALRLVSPENFNQLYTAPAKRQIPDKYLALADQQQQQQQLRAIPLITGIEYRVKGSAVESTASEFAQHAGMADMQQELLADIMDRAPDLAERIKISQDKYYKRQLRRGISSDVSSSGSDSDSETTTTDKKAFGNVSIIAVGTGSAVPAVYRNVIGTIVQLPFYEPPNYKRTFWKNVPFMTKSILFDCGESTLGNLARMFGPEVDNKLREIKVAFISHMHGDHHFGLLSLVKARQQAFTSYRIQRLKNRANADADTAMPPDDSTLYLIGPQMAVGWLEEWEQLYPGLLDGVRFIDARFFLREQESPVYTGQFASVFSNLSQSLRIATIRTVKAVHCLDSYSVSIEFHNGFKLSYSGDTRPNQNFVDIGKNTSLLIHEATMDDPLLADAIAKRHSTVSEALGVARLMSAQNLFLTHFSQRYPVSPRFYAASAKERLSGMQNLREDRHGMFLVRHNTNNTFQQDQDEHWNRALKLTLAYDGMIIKLKDMHKQGAWTDVLRFVFKNLLTEPEEEPDEVAAAGGGPGPKPSSSRTTAGAKRKRQTDSPGFVGDQVDNRHVAAGNAL
ncbi:beta-lactamase-like protein [Lipomyces kononenkoae]|uniref:Beta-lactamase-like protein n=1 Tax=Lipomyces kononenkoae TaxID=34357 RepID=A0ACC3SR59_LIPKO